MLVAVWVSVAGSSAASASRAARTVTFCVRFQLDAVNVSDAGSAVTSGLSLATDTVTSWDGAVLSRSVYVAESNEQALEEAVPAFQAERAHISEARAKLNPRKYVDPIPTPPSISSMPEHYLLAGTPSYVAEKIAELRDVGAQNVLLGMSPSHMARDRVQNSMKLFAEEVAPLFRGD